VGPRVSLVMVVKRKYPWLCREFSPGHTAHSLVTILTELSQLHYMVYNDNKLKETFQIQVAK